MIVHTIPVPSSQALHASPLTRDAFAPFGDVIANPKPSATPSNTPPEAVSLQLPHGAAPANQGTAIQYRDIASMADLYDQAPSSSSSPRMTMYVCAGRGGRSEEKEGDFEIHVPILERHPFTSQTFIPLTANPSRRYLVVVAPTLPPSPQDAGLPVPSSSTTTTTPGSSSTQPSRRGLPDLQNMRAFTATAEQAVTYAPGTWHAPMIALGPPDSSTLDFVVVQFASGVALEDCQEVVLGGSSSLCSSSSSSSGGDDGGGGRAAGEKEETRITVRVSSSSSSRSSAATSTFKSRL